MAIDDLARIRQGAATWNDWRVQNPESRVDLRGADLHEANLSGANLSGANLHEANLSGANLRGADLHVAMLRSDYIDVDYIQANLSLANLTGANLTGANLRRADLTGADLSGANLSGADLTGAHFSLADLSGANLSGADLTGANLSLANLTGANLTGANLRRANLRGAHLFETVLADIDLSATKGLDACTHEGPTDLFPMRLSGRFPDPFPPPFASAWGDDIYGLWTDLELPSSDSETVTQRLRWIEPGTFLMGSPATEADRLDYEGPRHEVTIARGFWLADTACTQALWQAVMGNNPSQFRGADRPVESVTWDDVQVFLAKINELVPRLALVLPSEAQWEYACRAGTETPFSFGETITPEQVNYGNSYRRGEKWLNQGETVPVASLPANPWGLYEMHGNVWEWCQDHWHETYDGAPGDGRAWTDEGADPGASRVLRGGSRSDDAQYTRSAFRIAFHPSPGHYMDGLGFRCARVQES